MLTNVYHLFSIFFAGTKKNTSKYSAPLRFTGRTLTTCVLIGITLAPFAVAFSAEPATSSKTESLIEANPSALLKEQKDTHLREISDEDITVSVLELSKLQIATAQVTLNSLQLDLQAVQKELANAKTLEEKASVLDTDPSNNVPQESIPDELKTLDVAEEKSSYEEKLRVVKTLLDKESKLLNEISIQKENIKILTEWEKTLELRFNRHKLRTSKEAWDKEALKLTQAKQKYLENAQALQSELVAIPADKNLKKQRSLRFQILVAKEEASLINQDIELHGSEQTLRSLISSLGTTDAIAPEGLGNLLNTNEELQLQLTSYRKLIIKKLELLSIYGGVGNVLSTSQQKKITSLSNRYNEGIKQLDVLNDQANSNKTLIQESIDESEQEQLSTRNGWPQSPVEWVTVITELRHAPQGLWEKSLKIFDLIKIRTPGEKITAGSFLIFWVFVYLVATYAVRGHKDALNRNETSYTRWMHNFIKRLIQQNLLSIFAISALPICMYLLDIKFEQYEIFFYLLLVLVIAKPALTLNRLLYEQRDTGIEWYDRPLYEGLKGSIVFGAILITIAVLTHHLPVARVTLETFDRLLMLGVLVASIVLLWRRKSILDVFRKLLKQRPRIFFVVQLVTLLFPAAGAITGAIGLAGYINLSWTLAYHEGVILIMTVIGLIARGYMLDFYSWWYHRSIHRMPHGWMLAQAIVKPLEFISRIILFVISVGVTFRIFGWSKDSTVVEKLSHILNFELFTLAGTAITPASIIVLVLSTAFFFWSAKWSREFAYRWLYKTIQDHGIRNSLSVFTQYAVVLFGVLMLLKVLGIDLTALAVLAGAIGVGIGFGLQTIANNFISGILLLIERPFRTGDFVNIGSHEGHVTRIGIRSLTVRTRDNIEVIIPNTDTMTSAFMNWTHMDNIVRSRKVVGISYNADPHLVQKLILETLRDHPNVQNDPAPAAWLQEFADSSVNFNVQFFIDVNTSDRLQVNSEIMFNIWDALKANNIEIPFPQQDIHIRSNSAGNLSAPSE